MTQETAQQHETDQATGIFVYGVVPADIEPTAEAKGVGDPPGEVTAVLHGDIAALVSQVRLDRPLGRSDDLIAYERLLDTTATVTPVLPVRFGTVLADVDGVTDMLDTHHDEFLGALHDLDGSIEYIVRARYVEQALLTEVLTENPEAMRLRESLADQPEELTVDLRIRLGEIVTNALEAKGNADTQLLVDTLEPFSEQLVVRQAAHEMDVGSVAMLVRFTRHNEVQDAVAKLAEEWSDRATVRLLGPLAPYDFVPPLRQEV